MTVEDTSSTPPIAFLSYSQTDETHSNRVLDLAIFLRKHGVNAKLDKWHLKDGSESNAFMESMVSEGGADKVIILCDRRYKERADRREGGVGTEAQILTPELYKQKEESKYVVVAMELDEKGEPCRPAFYGSRMYINLTDRSKAPEAYNSVLRFIFDKPLLEAPPIGEPPDFETFGKVEASSYLLKINRATEAIKFTSPGYKIEIDAVISEVPSVLDSFGYEFDDENLSGEFDTFFDNFISYREAYLSFFHAMCFTLTCDEILASLNTFFEAVFWACLHRGDGQRYSGNSNDRQRFFAREITIHVIGLFLRTRNYGCLSRVLSYEHLLEESGSPAISDLSALWFGNDTLRFINGNLERKYYDIVGEYIIRRCSSGFLSRDEVLCADLVLFLTTNTDPNSSRSVWYPSTAIYITRSDRLRLMIEARTKAGLQTLKEVIGAKSDGDLYNRFRDYKGEWSRVAGQFPRSIFSLVQGDQFYGYGQEFA